MLLTQFDRAYLGGQPVGKRVLVALAELAEPERTTDLDPMALERPTLPVVVSEQVGLNRQLLRDVRHGRRRQLLSRTRKRASNSKNFSSRANPSRVAPDLLPTRSQSSSTKVHEPARSSADHSVRTTTNRRHI